MSSGQTSNTKAFLFFFLAPALMLLAPLAGNWGFLAFYLISVAITIELTYQGFMRQSRFALSHKHPIINTILNWLLIILPFISLLSFGLSFALPLLLVIHLFSLARSPEETEKSLPALHKTVYRYSAWAILYCLGLGGYIVKEYFLAV